MPTEKNVRRAAVSALRAWSKGHVYADSLIERHSTKNHLSPQDRALLNAIVLGVLRHRRLLDHWIGKFRKGHLDHETRDILRVGLCQLLILGIPEHAAANETVNCARSAARGLINAVMRRATKAKKTLLSDLEDDAPALQHSHPDWLWKRWKKQFGSTDAEHLLQWNQNPAPTYLRLNSLLPTEVTDPTLASVENHLDFYEATEQFPSALVEAGHLYAQDPSTAAAARLLAPKPGERVLDACAAPGGKSILMAGLMQNEGELLCTDSNEKRLPRLTENLNRMGVTNATTAQFDWTTHPPSDWHHSFDAILLDVPCSNTGVFRRRVDARWRLKADHFPPLLEIQRKILDNALTCLKPGGRLVYSTCSIEPDENDGQISAFLQEHPELELKKSHQLLPFKDGIDGAFAALLQHR